MSADGLKTFIVTEQFTNPAVNTSLSPPRRDEERLCLKSAERVVFYLTVDFLFLDQTGLC